MPSGPAKYKAHHAGSRQLKPITYSTMHAVAQTTQPMGKLCAVPVTTLRLHTNEREELHAGPDTVAQCSTQGSQGHE